MKAIYKHIAIAALALSAVACSQDDDFAPSYLNDPDAVRITAQVGTNDVTGGFTRSNPLGDATAQAKFNSGDQISVTAGTQAPVTYQLGTDGWNPVGENYLKWEADEMNVTAYYPVGKNDASATTFTVPTEYTVEKPIADADYMTYSRTQSKGDDKAINLAMERKMVRIVITPDFNDQFPEEYYAVTGITVHGNTTGYADGEPVVGDIEVAAYEQDGVFYALLAPTAEDNGGTFLTVTVSNGTTPQDLTVKGIPATAAGNSYAYSLTVGKDVATVSAVSVNDWKDGTIPDGVAELVCTHEETAIQYVWSDDHSSCTAIVICNNCKKRLTETVTPVLDLSTLDETYVINDDAYYPFTGKGSYGIKVESGNPTIILNNASITVGEGSAIDIASGSNATIQVLGDNTIDKTEIYSGVAPRSGIFVAEGGTVNITSNGTDNVLRARGQYAAAIGGKYVYAGESYNAGSINISNVTVYAYTNNENAAAIGAAGAGTCGTINITNAVVYAYGWGEDCASVPGIGSAMSMFLFDLPETTPVVIISDSEIHTFRGNQYSDYIGYVGDEYGEEDGYHATGSINCGEGGSVKSSTIYCYTGVNATTTDKVVTYDADGNPTEQVAE